jgi:hypothetical protein
VSPAVHKKGTSVVIPSGTDNYNSLNLLPKAQPLYQEFQHSSDVILTVSGGCQCTLYQSYEAELLIEDAHTLGTGSTSARVHHDGRGGI